MCYVDVTSGHWVQLQLTKQTSVEQTKRKKTLKIRVARYKPNQNQRGPGGGG